MRKLIPLILVAFSFIWSSSSFAIEDARADLEKDLTTILKEKNTIVAMAKLQLLFSKSEFVPRGYYFEKMQAAYKKARDPLVKHRIYRHISATARQLKDTSLGYRGEKGIGKAQGCVRDYAIIGPFSNPSMENYDKALEPELGAMGPYNGRFESTDWRKIPYFDQDCLVAFDDFVQPATSSIVYSSTEIRTKKAQKVIFLIGSTSAYKIWVNGELVGKSKDDFGLLFDSDAWKVQLKKGKNTVFMKFASTQEGRFAHALRIVNANSLTPISFQSEPLLHGTKTSGENLKKDPRGLKEQIYSTAKKEGEIASWAIRIWAHVLSDDASTPWRNEADRLLENKKSLSTRALFNLVDAYEEYWKKRDILEAAHERGDLRAATYALSDLYLEGLTVLDRKRSKELIKALPSDTFRNIWEKGVWEQRHGSDRKAMQIFQPIWKVKVPAMLVYKKPLLEKFGTQEEVNDVRAELDKQSGGGGGLESETFVKALFEKRYTDALDYVRQRRLWAPDSSYFAIKEATILEAMGKPNEALAILNARIQLTPGTQTFYQKKAELLIRTNEKESAIASLKRILVYHPQNQNVKQRLRFLVPKEEAFYAKWIFENVRERAKKMPMSPYSSDTILKQTITKVNKNGLASKFVQHVERVNKTEGIESAKYQSAYFQGGEEEAEVIKVIVYKQDGSVSENFDSWTSGGTRKQATTYNDSARLIMQANDVEVGDLVEFRFVVNQVSGENFRGDYFGDIAYLQNSSPIGLERYAVIYPKSWKMYFRKPKLKSKRFEDTFPDGSSIGTDYHSTSFDFENVPEVRSDSSQPGYSEVYDYISVSNKKTYNEIGKWWWDLVHEQLIVDDEIKKKVKELTKKTNTDREKMKAIHNYVVRNTRYLHVGLGIHGWKPYRTTTCFRNRYGDCKDKASLLKVMLEEAGIKANLVLVRTRSLGDLEEYPASMHIFNHAITYVPKFKLFLDGTAEYNGTTELTSMDQGARGLIIEDGGNAKWVKLPVDKADDNLILHEMDVSITADTTRVRGKLLAKGTNAVFYRHSLEDAERRDEILEKQLSSLYSGAKLVSATYKNLENLEKPVEIEYVVEGANILKKDGNREYLLPMGRPRNLLDMYAKSSKRYQDLTISSPFKNHTKVQYSLSKGSVRNVPEDFELRSRFGSVRINYKKTNKALRVDVEYSLDIQRVSKKDYAEFRAFLRDATRALNTSIEVGKE